MQGDLTPVHVGSAPCAKRPDPTQPDPTRPNATQTNTNQHKPTQTNTNQHKAPQFTPTYKQSGPFTVTGRVVTLATNSTDGPVMKASKGTVLATHSPINRARVACAISPGVWGSGDSIKITDW